MGQKPVSRVDGMKDETVRVGTNQHTGDPLIITSSMDLWT